MANMGRPPTESAKIDKDELEKLMKLNLSEQEVSDWFDVQPKTLIRFVNKEFGCTFVQLRAKGFVRTKAAIKRAQIENALKGNTVLLIWLGKQYLGQSDKIEQTIELGERPARELSDEELDRLLIEGK